MNHAGGSAYGLWTLVFLNSALFIFFAFSFIKPRTQTDWRSLGVFSAFIVALFTEMYGFPLTIYLLSGWLSNNFPELDYYSHEAGHLWHTVLGWKGDPHSDPLHVLSIVFIGAGYWLLASSWKVLYSAQESRQLATTGPYSLVRHPQYVAFITIMFGFLLQWPTLPTLVMFPILTFTYFKLAYQEEKAVLAEFGSAYREYARQVPPFIPRLRRSSSQRNRHEISSH